MYCLKQRVTNNNLATLLNYLNPSFSVARFLSVWSEVLRLTEEFSFTSSMSISDPVLRPFVTVSAALLSFLSCPLLVKKAPQSREKEEGGGRNKSNEGNGSDIPFFAILYRITNQSQMAPHSIL